MISEMKSDDPFKGQYTPSGKIPRGRSALPKPKRKTKKARSGEDDAIPLDSVTSKKKSKKKKHHKGDESAESTGTFTVEAHVNKGYVGSEPGPQSKSQTLGEPDKASVKSNGTYTLGESKTSAQLAVISKPLLKRSPQKVKSMTQEHQKSKNSELDKVSTGVFKEEKNAREVHKLT